MNNPLFSVITPVCRPPTPDFRECVRSVLDQTRRGWELVLVDDSNDDAELLAGLADLEGGAQPVRVVRSPERVGVSGAMELGLQAAEGEFVAFLPCDGLLSPDALERVASAVVGSPDIDFLYSDEDKIDHRGRRFEPFYKPDWSPERFRSQMYTSHLSVVRRDLALEVGGVRLGFEGAQDYDLILRVAERARQIAHLREILYHRRVSAGPSPLDVHPEPDADGAARRALAEHCQRVGIDADVTNGLAPNTFRVARRLRSHPLVSLIIPSNGKVAQVRGRPTVLIEHLINSIEARTTYDNFEYVVVHDARMAESALTSLAQACVRPLTTLPYHHDDSSFNFSEAINRGAARAGGEILVLLNDDLELLTDDWLEELVGHVSEAGIGAVGGKYYFEDDTIQHAGVACAAGAKHLFYRLPRGSQHVGDHLAVTREVAAVTGACLAVSRDNFLAVGGFTEQLPINFNDVDFCLKLRSRGLRNIWTPHVEAYHFESKTRRAGVVDQVESDLLALRWGDRLVRDPYYNPNLQANPTDWVPYDDWQTVLYGDPELVRDVAHLDIDAYLAMNPDIAAVKLAYPEWDVVEHFKAFGVSERRTQAVRLRHRSPGLVRSRG